MVLGVDGNLYVVARHLHDESSADQVKPGYAKDVATFELFGGVHGS